MDFFINNVNPCQKIIPLFWAFSLRRRSFALILFRDPRLPAGGLILRNTKYALRTTRLAVAGLWWAESNHTATLPALHSPQGDGGSPWAQRRVSFFILPRYLEFLVHYSIFILVFPPAQLSTLYRSNSPCTADCGNLILNYSFALSSENVTIYRLPFGNNQQRRSFAYCF